MNFFRLILSTGLVIASLFTFAHLVGAQAEPSKPADPIASPRWIVQLDGPTDYFDLIAQDDLEIIDVLPSRTMALVKPKESSSFFENMESFETTRPGFFPFWGLTLKRQNLVFEFNTPITSQSKKTAVTSNDPKLSKQWPLNNSKSEKNDIDAPEAWAITTGSRNVKVAVIDSGIAYNHPDLAENIWVNTAEKNGRPNIDDDNNGYIDDIYGYNFYAEEADPADTSGHGTLVASIIGARGNNGILISGINWEVTLMALKAVGGSKDTGSIWTVLKSIEYAIDKDVDIINISLGTDVHSKSLLKMLERARDNNVLIVTGAGNEGKNVDKNNKSKWYPGSYNLPNIITVAASRSTGWRWKDSNYGKQTVDIAAPGDNVYGLSHTKMSKLVKNTGTSFAAPHVAGVAALLLSEYPNMTASEIKERILWTGRPTDSGSIYKKIKSGRIVNAYNALKDIHELDKDEREAQGM